MSIYEKGKCVCCNKKHDNLSPLWLHKDLGYMSCSETVEICDECLKEIYINEYGFEFVYISEDIYVKHPVDSSYDLVTNQQQIDKAFNPDYARFNEWRRNKGRY